ncbi:hypothetical protein [Streptomyces axinellae]|uniref:Integral membrane protein n=1 Tax=Streptomyces axinellae TaxID=552788 RepID=A0ABN3R036_9ACTN
MSDAHETGTGAGEPPARQPLPPEVPAPEPPTPAEESAGAAPLPPSGQEPGGEWWRAPDADGDPAPEAALPPQAPPPPTDPPTAGTADGAPASEPQERQEPAAGGGPEWWQGDLVRDEMREGWDTASVEAGVAAQELSHQLQHAAGAISDAVAGVAYPAAARRGLDIRWMRLSINLPSIAVSLLVTWGGKSATDRMVASVAEDGIFAPLGWVLLVVLLFGVVMVLPIGAPLAAALGGLVQAVASGLIAAVRRGWRTPVIGYLLRLVVAVVVWAFIFGVTAQVWRGVVHLLTGA